MEGYIVTFFTQQKREHNGVSVANWIVETAKQLGIRGATLLSGQEGFGHDGRFHSENIFDLEDRPMQVVLVYSRMMNANAYLPPLKSVTDRLYGAIPRSP